MDFGVEETLSVASTKLPAENSEITKNPHWTPPELENEHYVSSSSQSQSKHDSLEEEEPCIHQSTAKQDQQPDFSMPPILNEFSFRSRSFEDSLLRTMSNLSSESPQEDDSTPQYILKKLRRLPPVAHEDPTLLKHPQHGLCLPPNDIINKSPSRNKIPNAHASPTQKRIRDTLLLRRNRVLFKKDTLAAL